jgi:transcriptional regulator of NAD metabolism
MFGGITMKKLKGLERRQWIFSYLEQQNKPVTGNELAKLVSVSRQVIVNDITLLKATNAPIVATSQGYILMSQKETSTTVQKRVVCNHQSIDSEDELQTLVDAGVTVVSVTIEHPVYGEITSPIMVSNRHDVELFIKKVRDTGSAFLLELTSGIHLHLLSAPTEEVLNRGIEAIRRKGYLVED